MEICVERSEVVSNHLFLCDLVILSVCPNKKKFRFLNGKAEATGEMGKAFHLLSLSNQIASN